VTTPFHSEYLAGLQRHLLLSDETTLHCGYELGRAAVAQGISALDLAATHHDGLQALIKTHGEEHFERVIAASAAFFQEALSAFEMVHRGYREAASAAAEERRHAAMVRRLSSFLADASLSVRHPDGEIEVLHLVAEHGRELTGASYGVAACTTGGHGIRASSSDLDSQIPDPAVLSYLERIGHALPRRLSRAEFRSQPPLQAFDVVLNVLSVPIAALDDRRLGLLQLVDRKHGDFTDAHEAVAVHLADMAAAALERAELYYGQHASL
jgi:Phosphoserine phosphatase RsbU, N-terminal domain/GAF domain